MEEAINEGAAEAALFGLTSEDWEGADLTRNQAQDQLVGIFQAFRLGYFGSQVVEEYIMEPADGDVSPAWGLLGSALIAAAFALYVRPDGGEVAEQVRDQVAAIAGGEL